MITSQPFNTIHTTRICYRYIRLFFCLSLVSLFGCQTDSLYVDTENVSADFSILVSSDSPNGTIASATLTDLASRKTVYPSDGESISVRAFNQNHLLYFYIMEYFLTAQGSVFFQSDTVAGGEAYRFSWSRRGNGSNAENSIVVLPVDPQPQPASNSIVFGENITINWQTDANADEFNYRYGISNCGYGLDENDNPYYLDFTESSLNPRTISGQSYYTESSDTGSLTLNSQQLIDGSGEYAGLITSKLSQVELVDQNVDHYCRVQINFQRIKYGELDPKIPEGSITATQARDVIFYINVNALTGTI